MNFLQADGHKMFKRVHDSTPLSLLGVLGLLGLLVAGKTMGKGVGKTCKTWIEKNVTYLRAHRLVNGSPPA